MKIPKLMLVAWCFVLLGCSSVGISGGDEDGGGGGGGDPTTASGSGGHDPSTGGAAGSGGTGRAGSGGEDAAAGSPLNAGSAGQSQGGEANTGGSAGAGGGESGSGGAGDGGAGLGLLHFNREVYDFETVSIGSPRSLPVTVENVGSQPIGPIALAVSTTEFALRMPGASCQGVTLAASGATGSTCTFPVEFRPTTAGAKLATLSVAAGGAEHARAELRGSAATPVALSVNSMGPGSVESSPSGLVCPLVSCSTTFAAGTTVQLSAKPDLGAEFVGWSGACSGTGACSVTLNAATSVNAVFRLRRFSVSVMASVVGGATGAVTATTNAGRVIDCGAQCSTTVDYGTEITFAATPGAGFYFGGFGGDCSADALTCTALVTTDLAVRASFTPANVLFVSSAEKTALAWGGPAGADDACNALAVAAGLSGTFVSWTSSSASHAITRLGSTARGWVRVDGRPFADSMATLLGDHRSFYLPSLDERGNPTNAPTASATDHRGMAVPASESCADWSSAAAGPFITGGFSSAGAPAWSMGQGYACATPLRVYCLQKDRHAIVTPVPASGRRAFLSGNAIPATGGRAAADAECARSAASAGITGSFLALLATSTSSAASRFSTARAPWVRLDGVQLVAQASHLFANPPGMLAALTVRADGLYAGGVTWAGAASPGAVGSAATTCANWTTASPAATALVGSAAFTGVNFFGSFPRPCEDTYLVYCLEP